MGGVAGSGPSALTIGPEDYDAFEKLLREIQAAYGRENTEALGAMTTPEMLSYFSQDLAENAKKGVRNELSDAKLLQGDLSEAWQRSGQRLRHRGDALFPCRRHGRPSHRPRRLRRSYRPARGDRGLDLPP